MKFWLVPKVIRIEFPALDRLVDYLREQHGAQAAVDALTQTVAQSNVPLAEALNKTTKE